MDIPPLLRSSLARRLLVCAKIAGICLLIVLLHIPLFMTQGVLHEREAYRQEAAAEITATWGRRQVVTGPVLAVPYVYRTNVSRSKAVGNQIVEVDETEGVAATAYFLPDTLTIRGTVEPEIRRRGIHDVVVYSTALQIAGNFIADFAAAGIAADQINWDRAEILLGVTDQRGIRSVGPVALNGAAGIPFEAADAARHGGLGLRAALPNGSDGRFEFSTAVTLQGASGWTSCRPAKAPRWNSARPGPGLLSAARIFRFVTRSMMRASRLRGRFPISAAASARAGAVAMRT